MNAKNVHLIYIILLLTAIFSDACSNEKDIEPRLPGMPGDTLARTLIVYMAAENSLDNYLRTDSMEIAWGLDSIDDNSRIVLFIDDRKSSRLCVGTHRERLRTVKTYDGNICSTDSQTMANILQDIFRLYPARTYALTMCSHASGWLFDDPGESTQKSPRRSFGIDNGVRTTSNNGRKMNIPVLAGVLSGCPHFDYVFFDACVMQCIEVAYELRHVADYIIASPAEIPADGAPYTQMLRSMCTVPADPTALVEMYVDYYINGRGKGSYGGAELSAIRTDKLEHLAQVTAPLMNSLLANRTELNTTGIQNYYPWPNTASFTAFYDLKNLLYNYLDPVSYSSWVREFDEAVPVQKLTSSWYSAYPYPSGTRMYAYDIPHCGGVTIYIPREQNESKGWNDSYHQLEWYQATGMRATNW